MKHRLLDLFSGIGGFSLGAEANGIPTVAFVEKDPFCQKVLRKHWSNTPIISDIRTVKGEDYETDGVTIVSGGFPCQPFRSQENKKGEMTTDISGQKCLDSLKKSNPSSLLERMCKDLLTSKTAWSSDRCKMTWKVKVSKSNVSLYQLQASVLGTKEKESGSLDTMYPTPSASCQMDVVAPPDTVSQNSKGWSVTRLKTGTKFGAKLNDVVNKLNPGGKLNPNFVEFLMGYPTNWTKIEPIE